MEVFATPGRHHTRPGGCLPVEVRPAKPRPARGASAYARPSSGNRQPGRAQVTDQHRSPRVVRTPGSDSHSANTKIPLLTRIAFGFRSAKALIALAMCALGGGHQTHYGGHQKPLMSQSAPKCT